MRYRNPAIKQLRDQQIKYAPRDVQLTQISRAERLLDELNPAGTYRYPELCEKITTYRGEMYPDLVVSGAEAVHDLRCFVEDLSDSADIAVENAGEEVWTVDDVSKRFNVSSKTVSRWRDRGLVSRRFRFGGRKRVGFLRSSVERFVTKHADDVDRGTQFSQLSVQEREQLIYRARRLAKAGGCPTEISQRLARKFRRSPETVRYTLKNYDKDHPEVAVFPNALPTITDEDKRVIYRDFRKGIAVDDLAKRFGRTRASIYRLVSEVRAELLLEKPIDYMYSALFDESDAAATILAASARGRSEDGSREAAARASSVSEQPVFGPAAHQGGRGLFLPQDELPETSGGPIAEENRRGSAKNKGYGFDRAINGTGERGQEFSDPQQFAAGCVDREKAYETECELLRNGQRRKHLVDSRDREIRFHAWIQVFDLCQLGDYEEFRPVDSCRIHSVGSIPHG